MDMLDGVFTFVLLDTRDNSFMVARDAIGVNSLYIGWGLDGNVIEIILLFFSAVMAIYVLNLVLVTWKPYSVCTQAPFGYHQSLKV